VEYQLFAHVGRPEERFEVLSDLNGHIQDAFNEHGVQIMSPHYLADPPTAKTVPREAWFAAPARPE
jgi:small-conductance mechanosensitive channel